ILPRLSSMTGGSTTWRSQRAFLPIIERMQCNFFYPRKFLTPYFSCIILSCPSYESYIFFVDTRLCKIYDTARSHGNCSRRQHTTDPILTESPYQAAH